MSGDMLTIGAFAKACRLSPKALRLYDELELLRPARVDPDTGYRYYAVAQLERARLVAWLRRLGMPLAEIRTVCALDPPRAGAAIRAYWARVEAETAVRRDLAAFLVDQLTATPRKDTTMLELRYFAHSDRGRVRPANQDTAYAGARLLAVADGYGPAGGTASSAAVEALKVLDVREVPAGSVLNVLQEAVEGATAAVREVAGGSEEEAGTTLTAMLWTGSQLALVHIGDSRAYLLRDGALFRITHDHTVVQSMIDEGRLTPEEATAHPQAALLLKALTAGPSAAPDLRLHDARPGDRYLLCSDGLSGVVPDDGLRRVLGASPGPDAAVLSLVTAANEAGGPDNVSCVVADVVETGG
ncbi:MerR family transcriptional regulator [Streptomyces sp. Li-HN-5-11]|uniref:MerR family transcriptional regulator n=1 Tax=Streptomyces sp. Li-HN-5-11 TaxID=3075432 RepID=UPI0028ADA1E0|nr:MerR family transcriptional regulator [Streptomyces sp. Li-HN-5-11]WNM34925.1 MerR family transcriptional regulator [Streptomyces sp. Li-HN-5-11]